MKDISRKLEVDDWVYLHPNEFPDKKGVLLRVLAPREDDHIIVNWHWDGANSMCIRYDCVVPCWVQSGDTLTKIDDNRWVKVNDFKLYEHGKTRKIEVVFEVHFPFIGGALFTDNITAENLQEQYDCAEN